MNIQFTYSQLLGLIFLLTSVLIMTSCEDEETSPSEQRLKTGFVVAATQADGSVIAKYFAEMPSGTVDLSDGTAFQIFSPLSISDGALFMQRTDGSKGFAKMAVDGNENFVEDGVIATQGDNSFMLAVRDRNFGVFHDRNSGDILNTFDPSTMQVTGSIDMSGDSQSVPVRYQKILFRDNEIFSAIRAEAGETFPDFPVYRADLTTNRLTNELTLENAGTLVTLNRFGQFVLDESNNLYYFHSGNLQPGGVPGAIVRIPAGSTEFDASYDFKVPAVFNPANLASFMSSFVYYKNNKGFALINNGVSNQVLALIASAGGNPANLSQSQLDQLLFLLNTDPTGLWVEVDLIAQTITPVPGLPAQSVFDGGTLTMVGAVPHFTISVNGTVNKVFRYNPDTDTEATEVFQVMGGNVFGVFDLSTDQ